LKKRLFLLLASSVLSSVMLVGCNNNDDDDKEPVPTNNNGNTPAENLNYDRDNDVNDGDRMDNHYPESEDKNTDTDKDPGKDNNTPPEDIIEDDRDVNDKDKKDE
jgi:hypothetical protein